MVAARSPSPAPAPARSAASVSAAPLITRKVTQWTHVRTLLWKNALLKRRHWIATVLEVVIPLLFIILMGGLKTLTTDVTVPAGWSDTSGKAYTLTDPRGFSTYNLQLDFLAVPAMDKKYMATESTLSGLLLYLGLKSADEMRDIDALNSTQRQTCITSVALFGAVSTNATSPNAIPTLCRDHITPYKLAIAPDTAYTRQYFHETMKKWYPTTPLSNTALRGLGRVMVPSWEDSVVFFADESALNDYIKNVDYGKSLETPKIYAAIVFDQAPQGDAIGTYGSIEYSVRLNATLGKRGIKNAVPRTISLPPEAPFQRSIDTQYYTRYALLGFMTLQTTVTRFANCLPFWDNTAKMTNGSCQQTEAVAAPNSALDALLLERIANDFFMRAALPSVWTSATVARLQLELMPSADKETLIAPLRIAPQPYFETAVAAFPVTSFVSSPFYDSVQSVFALVFVLAYLFAVSRVLVVFIQEKETRSREYMKILGVPENAILVSWYITYTIIFFASTILQAIASRLGIFPNTDIVIIFLFFWFFGLSVLAFGYLISTFFSRARTGAFAGIAVFFFMYFVSTAFDSASSVHGKEAACLLPPVALAFGVQTLATTEATGVGVNFANANVMTNNFCFRSALGMLLLDTVLYTLIGMYLERVLPKEFGTREPWYFPFSLRYWRGALYTSASRKVQDVIVPLTGTSESGDVPAVTTHSGPVVETVSSELQQQERSGEALIVSGLRKHFSVPGGIKHAVRGVNLVMYKDQITCLLGHNGAGKSTLINMLTGMTAPSSGDAFFRGLSLTNNLNELRHSLGLCFQHDVLYGELTVDEHLRFYGRIKGYHGAELKEVVERKIHEVGLTEKQHVQTHALSGGMKRKLSVAICLLGDSALVFLDEPTSGMDPYSRRSTWEILSTNRMQRVMVLTTHFMDEADILGDRIAIMAEGKLKCCGSPLFLKTRFGVGYHLTLVKREATTDATSAIKLVTTLVPAAQILSHVGAEIAFQVPLDASAQLSALFFALDKDMKDLGMQTYGISVTTMEEVFIKVAEASDEEQAAQQHTLPKGKTAVIDMAPQPTGLSISHLHGSVMFLVHFSALLLKRFRVARRDRRVLIFSTALPILLLTAGLALLKSSSLTSNDVKVRLTPTSFVYASDMSVPYYCQDDTGQWCSDAMSVMNVSSTVAMTGIATPPYASATPTVFNMTYPSTELAGDPDSVYSLRLSERVYARACGKTDASADAITLLPVNGQYGAYLVYGSRSSHIFGYHTMVNTTTVHGSVIFKSMMDEALYRMLAKQRMGASLSVDNLHLRVNTYPLPLTATTASLFSSFLSFAASQFIVIAFAFFPASIVVFLVKEKQAEHNSKHQQLVSGVSLPAFWLSNYVWDMLLYVIPFGAAIALIQIFNIASFTGNGCVVCTDQTYGAVVLLFALFGLAICPFTYVLSFFFQDAANSQTYTILLNFILGVVLMVVSFVLDVVSSSSESANRVLKFFWRLSPLYNLGIALLNQSSEEIKANMGLLTTKPSPYSMDVMGWELLYLAIDSVLFFAAALGMDFVLSFPKLRAMVFRDPVVRDPELPPSERDEDVQKEIARVEQGGAASDAVTLQHLRKVYKGGKVAVRDVTFGLPKGECFGYLGINGAGKTTTMKMLTGDILPSAGIGKLGGMDILTQQLEVRRLIGYCPQFDALFELLTVREHLELFARIKGVSRAALPQVVRDLIHQLNLDDFEHKLAGTLSGGNKRKLSVAMAMIGSPPIIFLDEPSTGMDPVSRRFMWNVIAQISTQRKESTVILTTHSMEECEALCTRVGIMVGGRLRCLGSVQHLKNRFGNGLMAELKLENPPAEQVDERVTRCLAMNSEAAIPKDQLADACSKLGDPAWLDKIAPTHATGYALATALDRDGELRASLLVAWWISEERFMSLDAFMRECFGASKVQLIERQHELCRYKLLGDAQTLKLSHVFQQIEAGKQAQCIHEYAVSQTTLEQIFNFFAAQQQEEKRQARGVQQA